MAVGQKQQLGQRQCLSWGRCWAAAVVVVGAEQGSKPAEDPHVCDNPRLPPIPTLFCDRKSAFLPT